MTTLCFANCKGGTGKSSCCVALAQAAQHMGKSVLAIDLDPQANCSLMLGADSNKKGSYDLLTGERKPQFVIQHVNGIDVIPASQSLMTLKSSAGSARRLQNAIEPLKRKYDLIIIDTPPTTGELQFNALQASNGVIIPLQAEVLSLQGVYMIADLVSKFKTSNKDLAIAGAVICIYDGRATITKQLTAMIIEKLKALKIPYLGTVRKAVAIQEAQAVQQNLFDYAPKSKPAIDYMELYNKLMKKEGNL